MFKELDHRIDSFLDSLSYWETINLRTTLIRANHPELSLEDANCKATMEFSEPEKLRYDFERALKSGY